MSTAPPASSPAEPGGEPNPGVSAAGACKSFWNDARKYQVQFLSYIAAATATVYGLWKLLGQKGDAFGPANWQFWVALIVAILPVVVIILVRTLPSWWESQRRQRLREWSAEGTSNQPGYFRLTPYEESEADLNLFKRDDNSHCDALAWLRKTPGSLFYLIGVSGSGKSSALAAYIIPNLRNDTLVVSLRASDDPVGHLRRALLAPDAVWTAGVATKHREDGNKELLRNAAEHLARKGQGLLVVLDQFEELLYIHENDSSQTTPVLNLLLDTSAGQCGPARALVCLRIEAIDGLTRSGLQPLSSNNYFIIAAFTDSAARHFLSSGFKYIGSSILNQTVAELASLDELNGAVRPISLNMAGRMLRRLPMPQAGALVKRRPFSDYIRGLLEEHDIRDYAPRILQQLLDEQNRRVHKSVQELAGTIGDIHLVNGCLTRLATPEYGLVRCLNPYESGISIRRWEISHDFVATILSEVLPRVRSAIWTRARELAILGSFVFWWLFIFIWLPYEASRVRLNRNYSREVIKYNLAKDYNIYTEQANAEGYITATVYNNTRVHSFSQIAPLLNQLGVVKHIHIRDCQTIESIEGLEQLKHLECLDARGCSQLADIEPVRQLATLKKINLSGCSRLASVEPIRAVVGLESLDLSQCRGLVNFEPIQHLVNLKYVNLSSCGGLATVESLGRLKALESLNVSGCVKLTSLEPLRELTSLQHLNLSWCLGLTNIEPLCGLGALKRLELSRCGQLTTVTALRWLVNLEYLDLSGCEGLQSVEPVSDMAALNYLNVSWCLKLQSLEPLRRCKRLNQLYLNGCISITSIEPLRSLVELNHLDLGNCFRLISIEPLRPLRSIRTLILYGCRSLTIIESLKDLDSLSHLDLGRCENLTSIEPLRGTSALEVLSINGCGQISSVAPLYELKNLKYLDVGIFRALRDKDIEELRQRQRGAQIIAP